MSNIPPKTFARNKFGLLEDPPVPYVFNEDGTVNWRKMIRPEFLVPNKQRTQETDISKLEDKDLLILLGGIKELAQIRGFKSVGYSIPSATPIYVMAACTIAWVGNYETNNEDIIFEANEGISSKKLILKNWLKANRDVLKILIGKTATQHLQNTSLRIYQRAKKKDTDEGKKFWKSLAIADEQGILGPVQ